MATPQVRRSVPKCAARLLTRCAAVVLCGIGLAGCALELEEPLPCVEAGTCVDSLVCRPGESQWAATDGGNGHCYWLNSERQTWGEAQAKCADADAHLATITSAAELAYVIPLTTPGFNAWIGATDIGQPFVFEWVTQEPWWEEAPWRPNHPKDGQDCVGLYYADRLFVTLVCGSTDRALCERGP